MHFPKIHAWKRNSLSLSSHTPYLRKEFQDTSPASCILSSFKDAFILSTVLRDKSNTLFSSTIMASALVSIVYPRTRASSFLFTSYTSDFTFSTNMSGYPKVLQWPISLKAWYTTLESLPSIELALLWEYWHILEAFPFLFECGKARRPLPSRQHQAPRFPTPNECDTHDLLTPFNK